MAIVSKGIMLFHNGLDNNAEPLGTIGTKVDGFEGVMIPGVQEIGDLSAGAGGVSYDQIEVTTLADTKHVYADGLLADESDTSLAVTLLYDPKLYKGFLDVIDIEKGADVKFGSEYHIYIPNGDKYSRFTLTGKSSIKVNGTSVNSALTMALTITPSKEVEFEAELTPGAGA